MERVLLAPLAVVRPYRCALCGNRRLRFAVRGSRAGIFALLLTLVLGIVIVHLIWILSTTAPDHPGAGYQPKDMERFHFSKP